MGICFSSANSCFSQSQKAAPPPSSANVVSNHGDLHQYNVPISVSQVIHVETSSSSSSSSSSYFLCNSDLLTYDDYIPPLDPDHLLHPNQIYFLLPASKLHYRLSASDMAALAFKATVAIQNASKRDARRRSNKKTRISPLLSDQVLNTNNNNNPPPDGDYEKTAVKQGGGVSRSTSARRLHKYTSRRAKFAVRSFRLKLTTIYEGAVL